MITYTWLKKFASEFLAMRFAGTKKSTKLISVDFKTFRSTDFEMTTSDLYYGVSCRLKITVFFRTAIFEY